MKILNNPKCFIFIALCAFLTLQGYSQSKVEQYNANGLSTTVFYTTSGKITVYLPEHGVNENISGTVNIEPLGSSENRRLKNSVLLKHYRLSLGGVLVSIQSNYFSLLTSSMNIEHLQLLNEQDRVLSRSVIQTMTKGLGQKVRLHIPDYMVAGEPTKITAICDGDLGNNSISINTNNTPILAESESGVYFIVPDFISGKSQVKFTNGLEILERSVNVLVLDLSIGRTDLMRGETTNLAINISGFEGLEPDVPVEITNNSTSNISLEGGNLQEFAIDPIASTTSGNYFKQLGIKALQRGGFSISVKVVPPRVQEQSIKPQSLLCNCRLNGQSYLISQDACVELGGDCTENNGEETGDILEDESPPNYSYDLPDEITDKDDFVNLLINDFNKNDCVAVLFSYKPIDDDQWQTIGIDNTFEDGLNVNWNPPLGNDGVVDVRARVVNKNNIQAEYFQNVVLNITPATIFDATLNVSYTVSENDIKRALERARAIRDRIKEEEEKQDELEEKIWDEIDNKKANKDSKNKLIAIDRVLDKIPRAYRDSLKVLVDSLANLKKQLPAKIDKKALQKAVDDAQKRLDDCNKRVEALKKEQADLEKQRDDLKDQLDDVQKAIYDLHIANGWRGDYGYHADGRPWYGYIGGERANVDLGDENYELRKQYKGLKKEYLKTLKSLGNLPAEIAEAQAECDELNEALEKAKTAAEKGDQHMATEVAVDDICRQIKSLLKPLLNWCVANPESCNFKEKLRKLLEECPKDIAALEDFWDEFNDIIKAKKAQEKAYGDAANADQDKIDAIDDEIKNSEDKIKALKEQERRAYAEAERIRRQRAQELENARNRKREAEARKREAEKRKAAKPEPYLDEPVDPSDDQLKLQAQAFIFKTLYMEYLVSKGPCDCVTKAMAFANNTNSIVSDLIGRIAVGVAFAPLEAFPGVSLAGRLGIGAVKALAGALFGGQSFSEELTKNLFNAIGGEIFPKLTGNGFTGDRLNDLAGKGLEEILEAEGVRAISWEGKTKLRNCGEVSGKTTMLINPKTGWVTIMIKIDDCPLIVIKYKVNKDGVPISKPIVKKING